METSLPPLDGAKWCSSFSWRAVIAASVLIWRLINAWWMVSSFAPDEYYQAIEPAYLYATGQLLCRGDVSEPGGSNLDLKRVGGICGIGGIDDGSGSGPLRSLRALPWEWWPQHGLRPALPVLLLAQLHKLVLSLEARGLVSAAAAGALHPRLARLAGAMAVTVIDFCAPALAQRVARPQNPRSPRMQAEGSKLTQHQNTWATSLTLHALAWSLLGHWAIFSGTRALPNAWEATLAAAALALVFPYSPGNDFSASVDGKNRSCYNESNSSSCIGSDSGNSSSDTLVATLPVWVGWGCAASAALLRPSGVPFWAVVFVASAYQVVVDTSYSPYKVTQSSSNWCSSGLRHGLKWALVEVLPPALAAVLLWSWADGHWYGWTCAWTPSTVAEATAHDRSPAEVLLAGDERSSSEAQCWLWRPRVWAPLAWLKFNWRERSHAASLFGHHPWHWYATAGVWAVAGPPLLASIVGAAVAAFASASKSKAPPLSLESLETSSGQSKAGVGKYAAPTADASTNSTTSSDSAMNPTSSSPPSPSAFAFDSGGASWGWWAAAAHLTVHSLVPHKEERFLHMLLPLANAYAARASCALMKRCMAVDQAHAKAAIVVQQNAKPFSLKPSRVRQVAVAGFAAAVVSLGAGVYLLRVHQVS